MLLVLLLPVPVPVPVQVQVPVLLRLLVRLLCVCYGDRGVAPTIILTRAVALAPPLPLPLHLIRKVNCV